MIRSTLIPYVSTLEQVYEEFNETLISFVTFIHLLNGEEVKRVSVPWCRFRQSENDNDVIIARNCDCDGTICGLPSTIYPIKKDRLKDYIFFDVFNQMNYVFIYDVSGSGDVNSDLIIPKERVLT